jgi:hypothetical protein
MKRSILLSIFILFFVCARAQKSNFFAQFGGGYYNGKGIQNNQLTGDGRSGGFGAEVTVNAMSGNIVGLGVGMDVIKFNNADHPFLPLFADIKFIAPGKSRFYIMIDPGYCFYNYSSQGTTQTGGLYIASGLGIWFPSKTKQRLFLQVKYNFITINNSVVGYDGSTSGSIGVFSFLLGVKI